MPQIGIISDFFHLLAAEAAVSCSGLTPGTLSPRKRYRWANRYTHITYRVSRITLGLSCSIASRLSCSVIINCSRILPDNDSSFPQLFSLRSACSTFRYFRASGNILYLKSSSSALHPISFAYFIRIVSGQIRFHQQYYFICPRFGLHSSVSSPYNTSRARYDLGIIS